MSVEAERGESALSPSFRNIVDLLVMPMVGWFVGARTLASIGVWMERLATGWLTWEMTGSAAWVGAIAFLRLFPALVLGPLGGALADRTSPLFIMRSAKIGQIAGNATILALLLGDALTILGLAALVFWIGCAQAIANPANKSLIWYLVPRPFLPVAIPVNSITFNIAAFVGPAGAGLLIATQGAASVYALVVAVQIFFLTVLLSMRLAHGAPGEQPDSERSIIGDIVAGLNYARTDRVIFAILTVHLVFSITARPLIDLMPAVAGTFFEGDARLIGNLTACLGAGAILGGVLLAARSRLQGMTVILMTSMVLLMALLILLALNRSEHLAYGLLFVMGGCMIVRASGTQTLLQFAVVNEMRGRTMGLYGLCLRAGSALGALVIGMIAEQIGLAAAIGGAAALGGAMLIWRWRPLMRLAATAENR